MDRALILLLVGICSLAAFGGTATLDLLAWQTNVVKVDGWTLTDMLKYTGDGPLKGAAYFRKNGSSIVSPDFPAPIVRVRVESATTSTAGIRRDVSLVPIVGGTAGTPILLERPEGKTFVEESLSLSGLGATSFSLTVSGTSGNWAVRKVSVAYGDYVPEVSPVSDLSVFGRNSDSFSLVWSPVDDAVAYVVDVWTNDARLVHENVVVTNCGFDCSAESVVYGYAVRARFSIAGEVRDSASATGRVDMSNPPWLRCWKLSDFLPRPGSRAADFSGIGTLAKRTAWTNGLDGDCFYAFKNRLPATFIRPATDSSVYADLYCYNAGTEDAPTNGLALLASKSTDLKLILPIRIDSPQRVESLSASYGVRVVNEGGSNVVTRLSFAWAVCGGLWEIDDVDASWKDVEEGAFSSDDQAGFRTVNLPGAAVRASDFILLRWSVPRQSHSAMMGLADVRVTGTLRNEGSLLMIR